MIFFVLCLNLIILRKVSTILRRQTTPWCQHLETLPMCRVLSAPPYLEFRRTPPLCWNPTQEPWHKQQIRILGWLAPGITCGHSPRPTTGPRSPAPKTAFLGFPPRTTLPTSRLPSNPYLQVQYWPWGYNPDVQHAGSAHHQALCSFLRVEHGWSSRIKDDNQDRRAMMVCWLPDVAFLHCCQMCLSPHCDAEPRVTSTWIIGSGFSPLFVWTSLHFVSDRSVTLLCHSIKDGNVQIRVFACFCGSGTSRGPGSNPKAVFW